MTVKNMKEACKGALALLEGVRPLDRCARFGDAALAVTEIGLWLSVILVRFSGVKPGLLEWIQDYRMQDDAPETFDYEWPQRALKAGEVVEAIVALQRLWWQFRCAQTLQDECPYCGNAARTCDETLPDDERQRALAKTLGACLDPKEHERITIHDRDHGPFWTAWRATRPRRRRRLAKAG